MSKIFKNLAKIDPSPINKILLTIFLQQNVQPFFHKSSSTVAVSYPRVIRAWNRKTKNEKKIKNIHRRTNKLIHLSLIFIVDLDSTYAPPISPLNLKRVDEVGRV